MSPSVSSTEIRAFKVIGKEFDPSSAHFVIRRVVEVSDHLVESNEFPYTFKLIAARINKILGLLGGGA